MVYRLVVTERSDAAITVPVMDGKHVMGIVSNRDVVVEAISHRESLLTGMDVLIANHEFPT